jgi:hypothetical protein
MSGKGERRKELRRIKLGSVILHAYLVVAGIIYGGIYGTTYRTTHKEDGRFHNFCGAKSVSSSSGWK